MRAFGLISLALLAVVGHAFDTHAWTRALEAHNLDSRSPKGGKGGGGGGGGDDEDDEGGSSDGCVADQCPPDHELCGSLCIPTGTTCCDDFGSVTNYCQADERCVSNQDTVFDDPDVSLDVKCCPADDEGCGIDSGNATEASGGTAAECESGAAGLSGVWAVGVLGALVALGL